MAEPRFNQNTIALVYDFDGTLSPRSMQDYTLLPELGLNAPAFWQMVDDEVAQSGAEPMLVYMRLLLEKARERGVQIRREDYRNLAPRIEYFPGVEDWFDRIGEFVSEHGHDIRVKHYIVSAGMREILEGVSIRKHFARIYASEYHFDQNDIADFPNRVITDTTKTQYLFRINKGRETAGESINEHMDESVRPIPFSNIIYIGDGMTDVPSMAVTRSQGGHAVAVYRPEHARGHDTCRQLLDAGRVDFIAEADYSEGGELWRRTTLLLNAIMANIEYRRELFYCKK
jgi:2-hydroxy-3-keto-5-methylthiopentenyl-1-phosphate phosphatase